jgi:hypothetical protein
MRIVRLAVFALFALSIFTPAQAVEVNVSQRWCNNGCSEGHNDTACVCTYNGSMSPSNPAAWVGCEELPCCDFQVAYCDLGYVNQDQCYPREVGHGGEAYEPLICNTITPHGEKSCEVGCGESGCYIHYYSQHFELVNEQGPNFCTASNETCVWWQFWELPWCLASCTLEAQTPWDDYQWGRICG